MTRLGAVSDVYQFFDSQASRVRLPVLINTIVTVTVHRKIDSTDWFFYLDD